jgi:soluble lytic murein transglycosylase-like protein
MSEAIGQVLARIQEIQNLLGEAAPPNEEFRGELDRSTRSGSADCGMSSTYPAKAGRSPSETQCAIRTAPESLTPLIEEAAGKTGLPGELISAVMETESGFRPDAVSPAGAQGLMQLMPGTARALGVDDPYDPRQNVLGGAEYLRRQLGHFGTVEKALAAYNAGPAAVEQYGGIPPFSETQNYVRRVLQRVRHLTRRRE